MGRFKKLQADLYYMIIKTAFNLLFFLVPLVFFSKTSELFEFNKIILLYILATIILGAWTIESIRQKRLIFKRTQLDLPLVFFLAGQILSTYFSIDQRTSLLGYYSRFNGGLVSSICYSFLYWAYVSNIRKSDVLIHIRTIFLTTFIVSIYGILEHFGRSPSCYLITRQFNADCWVQEVQLRVFATFGQPNWMAAWLIAVIPLLWGFSIDYKKFKISTYLMQNLAFIMALLYTKSRSGILGLAFGIAIFLLGFIYLRKKNKVSLKSLSLPTLVLLTTLIFIGTPWSPNIGERFKPHQSPQPVLAPALEVGGTESGDIRKIVWQGAVDVWRHYPIFGSGVETFAFAYYEFRPIAHNLTSEWNFLYNKAHNEYLNYLANTGTVGFVGYALLITASLAIFIHNFFKTKSGIVLGLLSGYIAILVSNFFGFSVVPISTLTFLFPAIAISRNNIEKKPKIEKFNSIQKIGFIVVILVSGFALYWTFKYWYADYMYAQAMKSSSIGEYETSNAYINKSVSIAPLEALYRDELAKTKFALGDIAGSVTELNNASRLSPRNVKLLKSKANTLMDIGDLDSSMYIEVINLSEYIRILAPTDPSVLYTMGLTYAKMGQAQMAIEVLEHAIQMKPNYKNARVLVAILYEEEKDYEKAKEHLEYILSQISPDDEKAQKDLQKINDLLKSK